MRIVGSWNQRGPTHPLSFYILVIYHLFTTRNNKSSKISYFSHQKVLFSIVVSVKVISRSSEAERMEGNSQNQTLFLKK